MKVKKKVKKKSCVFVSLYFSTIFNSTFLFYLSSLDEKMFKPFSLLQWLDLHGSLRWPSAASMLSSVLSGACMYHAPMSVCVKRTECV